MATTIPVRDLKRGDVITQTTRWADGRTVEVVNQRHDTDHPQGFYVQVVFVDDAVWDLDSWDIEVAIRS